MFTRPVRVFREATSLPVAMMRIWPSSTLSRKNGMAENPTSTCAVMVCVSVPVMLPVDVGLAVSLCSAISASSPAWLDEPVSENATVLPLKSSTLRMGELAGTYQYRSGAPITSLAMMRIGAPLAKVPTAADTPAAVAISTLPAISAWIRFGPCLGGEDFQVEPVLLEDAAATAKLGDAGVPGAPLRHRHLEGVLRGGGAAAGGDAAERGGQHEPDECQLPRRELPRRALAQFHDSSSRLSRFWL